MTEWICRLQLLEVFCSQDVINWFNDSGDNSVIIT